MAFTRYGDVVRSPGMRWLLPASLIARLPVAMTGLALVFVVTRAGGSYARAGLVTACYVAGAGAASPVWGRLVDRLGRRKVLVPTAALNAAGLITLSVVPQRMVGAVMVVAALSGVVAPPVSACARSLWPRLVAPSLRTTVYALEATLQEGIFIAGPALVALLAGIFGAGAALAGTGVAGLVGVGLFVAHPGANLPVEPVTGHASGAWRIRELRRLVVATSVLITAVGMVDLSVVAFASHGRPAGTAGGALLAVWSVGSMIGGLLVGARPAMATSSTAAAVAVAGAGFALLALAPGTVGLGLLLLVTGLTIAPAIARVYADVSSAAPADVATEAFTWLASGALAGSAAGNALGGAIIASIGPRPAFLCAAATAVASALLVPAPARGPAHEVLDHLSSSPGQDTSTTTSKEPAAGDPVPTRSGEAAGAVSLVERVAGTTTVLGVVESGAPGEGAGSPSGNASPA